MRHDADRIKAVVLTTQRTGSTFLMHCLNSHPEIECGGEILIGLPDELPQRPGYRGRFKPICKMWNIARRGAWLPGNRMRRFYAGGQGRVRAFKAMYNQLRNPFALRYLQRHLEIRVIHLHRENLLKVHVSRLLMPAREHLQATGPVEPVRVRVEPFAAIAFMRNMRARKARFDGLFARHARLSVAYERLIDGQFLHAEAARGICEFLGVAQLPMTARLTKLNPDLLRAMVTNYDELAAAVKRTEFASLLD